MNNVTLIGMPGVGKSTLIKAISGSEIQTGVGEGHTDHGVFCNDVTGNEGDRFALGVGYQVRCCDVGTVFAEYVVAVVHVTGTEPVNVAFSAGQLQSGASGCGWCGDHHCKQNHNDGQHRGHALELLCE